MKVVAIAKQFPKKWDPAAAVAVEEIREDRPLRLSPDDVVFVDPTGNRLIWSERSPSRVVAGVLPTVRQRGEIASFLESGGKVLTCPADPDDPVTIPLFFPEELPNDRMVAGYSVMVDGGLAEIEIPPFDWLPEHLRSELKQAFRLLTGLQSFTGQWEWTGNHLHFLKQEVGEAVAITIGKGVVIVCCSRELERLVSISHTLTWNSDRARFNPSSRLGHMILYAGGE